MNALMTIRDAAKTLALSESMIRKLIASGRLTAVRIGRAVRVRVDEIHRLIAAGGQ